MRTASGWEAEGGEAEAEEGEAEEGAGGEDEDEDAAPVDAVVAIGSGEKAAAEEGAAAGGRGALAVPGRGGGEGSSPCRPSAGSMARQPLHSVLPGMETGIGIGTADRAGGRLGGGGGGGGGGRGASMGDAHETDLDLIWTFVSWFFASDTVL